MKNYNVHNMVDIGGTTFVLDLDAFSKFLETTDSTNTRGVETKTRDVFNDKKELLTSTKITKDYDKGREVDATKYDVIRMCLEIVLMYPEEVDDSLGLERALNDTTIPFKLAFNTLVYYGILKEIE